MFRFRAKAEHRITDGNYSVMSYQLSRDGRKIAFHRAPTPLLEDMDQSEIWVMDSGGGGARQITHNKVSESGAAISPDGSQILFTAQADQKFETYYNSKIFIAPANGGEARALMPDLPYEVERAAWSKDGKSIFFLANMGVHAELFEVSAAGWQTATAHQRESMPSPSGAMAEGARVSTSSRRMR